MDSQRQFLEEMIESANSILEECGKDLNGPIYSRTNRQMARMKLDLNEELEAIYHLTESHGVGLRQQTNLYLEENSCENYKVCSEVISFRSGYGKERSKGLLKRLQEMPSEWTVVQITREYDPDENYKVRFSETSPTISHLHITRLPCGAVLNKGMPVTVENECPSNVNFIELFWNLKKDIRSNQGPKKLIQKNRKEAGDKIERYCREMGQYFFKYWIFLLLGRFCDKSLEKRIESCIDEVLKSYPKVSKRERYLLNLIASCASHLNAQEIDDAIFQVIEENEKLQDDLFNAIKNLKNELSSLPLAKRHPVILIIDEHLDLIPWENFLILSRHPYSRVPSIHFLHSLYKIHKDSIKNGLREIPDDEAGFSILNPGGDLPLLQELVEPFFKKRFPDWGSIMSKVPTQEEFIQALTSYKTFVYGGHGSGHQYLLSQQIASLDIKGVQFLFGCSSAALKDHGGVVEMTADCFSYIMSGSGCTVGALWPVLSGDVDRITIKVANICFPGIPVDPKTLKPYETPIKKEPELLRALIASREEAVSYINKCAFVVRGLPIKFSEKN